MSRAEDVDRETGNNHDNGIILEAHASDEARIYQAARDLHIRYESGTSGISRVYESEVVDECPYPGLAAFGPETQQWFFGRDAVLAELVGLLAEQSAGPAILVASSGAGKSSLLHAGLAPALARGVLPQSGSRRWPQLIFTPGLHPVSALAAQLSAAIGSTAEQVTAAVTRDPASAGRLVQEAVAADRVPGGGVAVVVDQFEEVFTLCDDEHERQAFISALCALGSAASPETGLVVLALRADFYQHACGYPDLRLALRDRQVVMGPMSETELRQAILYPSQAVGLELEPGLVELLIRDLGGAQSGGPAAGYDAGRLPLLAHALRVTWQQRQGHVLSVDGYAATGGIHHAIAATAERTFGRLDDSGQGLARLLFLRLVKIGDGTDDTRRRATRAQLTQDSGSAADAVIDAFTRVRLITHELDAVEITHEALLREWPRLREWIDTDHAGQLIHQALEEDAAVWASAATDASRLYRGARLESARTWAGKSARRDELSARAHAFLTASDRSESRARRLRRVAVTALTVLAIVASGSAAFAFTQRQSAVHDRDQAVFTAVSAEAASLSSTNVSLAAELDLVAYRMNPTPSAYTSLISTEATGLATPLSLGGSSVSGVAFGDGGKIVAAGGGDSIQLWNIADAQQPALLGSSPRGLGAVVESVNISPDGRTLAAGLSNGTVRLWDISQPAHPTPIGTPLQVAGGQTPAVAAFAPGRHLLLVAVAGNIQLWNASRLAAPVLVHTLMPCGAGNTDSASVTGSNLAAGCFDGSVYLADIANPARPQIFSQVATPFSGDSVSNVAFSPDGRTLLTISYVDQQFILWNVADPRHPAADGTGVNWLTDGVSAASFAPDGSVLATADHNGAVQLWNIADPANIGELGPPMTADSGPVLDVAYSPDGRTLVSGSSNGKVLLWNIPQPLVFPNAYGFTSSLAFSPDGGLLAGTNEDSGELDLWNVADPSGPRTAAVPAVCETTTELAAFAPRRRVLAVGCDHGLLKLWNVADPSHLVELGPPLDVGFQNDSYANSVAFDRSGRLLGVGASNGLVTLWNVANPAHATLVGFLNTGFAGFNIVSLSPDGHILAASVGTTVRLWNVSSPAHPRPIGGSLTGPAQNVTALAFSHDGDLLAVGSADDRIYLWNLVAPRHPRLASPPLADHTDFVTSVAFSPDDRLLASSSYDDTVRLWRVSRPAHAGPLGQPLTGHTDYALAVAFSPRGTTLASMGLDGVVYLWDTNVNEAIARICTTTQGVLTRAQWQRELPGVPYRPPCDKS